MGYSLLWVVAVFIFQFESNLSSINDHLTALNSKLDAICYDAKGTPIFDSSPTSVERCVYSSQLKGVLSRLPTARNEDIILDCRNDKFCYAACVVSNCMSVELTTSLVKYKSFWTDRYILTSCIYSVGVIIFLIFMYISNKRQIRSIGYPLSTEESINDAKSGTESEVEIYDDDFKKEQNSLSDSFSEELEKYCHLKHQNRQTKNENSDFY